MVSNITLTSPIRSNLLSLTNIAKQMDKTQLILATGKKVNTALDNASAYYQARSLTNRSADLNALLDAMDQGIQTIEAASQGIETATSLLEQMQSITTQAGAVGQALSKEDLQGLVGANGAVVETADELRAAINSGKETICVYGNIDLGDITDTGGISLQANQKLVGAGYFGDKVTECSIIATSSAANSLIDIKKNGCIISNLTLSYSNSVENSGVYVINVEGGDVITDIQNINIDANFSDINLNRNVRTPIAARLGATVNLGKNINLSVAGYHGCALYSVGNSRLNILSGADVNINTSGYRAYGIHTVTNSKTNIEGNINITTLGVEGYGIVHSGYDSGNYTFVASTAQIYFNTSDSEIYHAKDRSAGNNILEIAQGAKLAFEKNDNVKWYEVSQDYKDENDSNATKYIRADNITTMIPGISETTPWTLPTRIETDDKDTSTKVNVTEYQNQFNSVLGEYNKLINDCSYQGINLLKGGNLKVVFNEHRSHVFNVLGQDITAAAIGLNEALWQTTGDINRSVAELTQAITTLRSLAESLGNQYSIIQTRADFTEGLTDILETGADELTLADMNEASAQYLSLQTRQQLALNSLSLAAQSAQSVLSLFS